MTPKTHTCPECQIDLAGLSPRKHALAHWPELIEPNPTNELARARQAELNAMDEEPKSTRTKED